MITIRPSEEYPFDIRSCIWSGCFSIGYLSAFVAVAGASGTLLALAAIAFAVVPCFILVPISTAIVIQEKRTIRRLITDAPPARVLSVCHGASRTKFLTWRSWDTLDPSETAPLGEAFAPTAPTRPIRTWFVTLLVAAPLALAFLATHSHVFIYAYAFALPLVGILAIPLVRSYAMHPLRMLGRWSVIADPEGIEIPNLERGSRTYAWANTTLVIVGVYRQTAHIALRAREDTAVRIFNIPTENLGHLVALAKAEN